MIVLSYSIRYMLFHIQHKVFGGKKKYQHRSFWKGEIILSFTYFCIYSSSYIITSRCSYSLPPHLVVPLESKSHYSFISHQKRASIQGWTRQLNGKSQKKAKKSETSLTSTVRSPTRTLNYTAITYAEDLT